MRLAAKLPPMVVSAVSRYPLLQIVARDGAVVAMAAWSRTLQ